MATENQPFKDSTSLIKDLIQGQPNTTKKFETVTQGATPAWMQEAIYDQTQLAKNFAQTPYQPYMLPTLAGLTDQQKQAYGNISSNVANAATGKSASWQPDIWNAQSGMFDQTSNQTGQTLQTDQNAYLRNDLVDKNLDTAQSTWDTSSSLSPLTAAQDALNQASGLSANTAASDYLNLASGADITGAGSANYTNATAVDVPYAAENYLSQAAGVNVAGAGDDYLNKIKELDITGAGSDYLNKAGGVDIAGAGSDYLNKAGGADITGAAGNYLNKTAGVDVANAGQNRFNQAANVDVANSANPYFDSANRNLVTSSQERALAAADPYMRAASGTAASGVQGYMNPYQTGVMDALAQQSARNLKENILPNVSDAFIKAGNFGSARMGEFGSRAVRDANQTLQQQQAALLNQGYGQAVSAAQADLSRQAQLANIAGNTAGTDLNRLTQNAGAYNQQGQVAGQLANQQAQLYSTIGQNEGQLAAQQAQIYNQAAQTAANAATQQGQLYQNIGQTQGQLATQQGQLYQNIGQTQGQLATQQAQAYNQAAQTAGQLTNQQAQIYNQAGQTAASAAAQQGQLYNQAAQGQTDAAAKQASLYGQLGQTAGNLTAQDMQNYANIGQTAGQLTNAEQQNLINLGQQQTAAGQAQQTAGLNAAMNVQTATAQDYQRQVGALNQYANLIGGEQQLLAADNAALEAAGAAQQRDLQAGYDVAKQQFYAPLDYARNNIDFLNTQIKGLQPITPMSNTTIGSTTGQTYSPSPLATAASAYNTVKGMTSPNNTTG